MRLTFKQFDGRSFHVEPIIDEETGKRVGTVSSRGTGYGSSGIDVSLFDGKYRITVHRFEAALGFVKGVEAVLNHMVHIQIQSTDETKATKSEATDIATEDRRRRGTA